MGVATLNRNELLELQKKYRNGEIEEENMSKEEIEQLKELYKQQIKALEESIEEDKNKILEIRKKLI